MFQEDNLSVRCWKLMIPVAFGFRAPAPEYHMGGYIRASGFALYVYVLVTVPNKHDYSRHTRLCGNFCHVICQQ